MRIRLSTKNQYLQFHLKTFLSPYFKDEIEFCTKSTRDYCDILVVDTTTVSKSEIYYPNKLPVLLYTIEIKPFLLNYFNSFEVSGVLSFTMAPQNIQNTINATIDGEVFFDEEILLILFSKHTNDFSEKIAALTSREMEIVRYTLEDLTNEEIAKKLDLSIRTINAHKGNITRKIGTKTTSGLLKLLYDYSSEFRMIF